MMPTVERLEISEVTAPYVYTEMFLLTRKPGKYVDPFAFAMSFSLEICDADFWILGRQSVSPGHVTTRGCGRGAIFLHLDSELRLGEYLLAKHKRVKNASSRMMLGTWNLSVFIVAVLLSSRLVSTMLVKSTEDHVDTLEDVLRFPKLKILAERGDCFRRSSHVPLGNEGRDIPSNIGLLCPFPMTGTILHQRLRSSSKSREKWSSLRDPSPPGPKQDECFDWVERGTHVILYERNFQDATLARRFAERGRCRFRRARQSLNLQPLGMILWKGLKPELKKTITIL
ncbi:hypothetical protein MTO96_025629 [Rhipicephalus appendiculatus]